MKHLNQTMKIKILTIFPNFFNDFLSNSIIKRAISKKIVSFEIINIRSYSLDKNKRIDDTPIGGGAGLIMQIEPLYRCLKANSSKKSHSILLTPTGKKYSQKDALRLSKEKELILICGHYEGIDHRFNSYVDERLSIGDYILTGGEIPALVISDSITRLLDGVINKESIIEESFNSNMLEYPQYTYPYNFKGDKIPDILYCGNHQIIDEYHKKMSLVETYLNRPDLIDVSSLSKEEKEIIELIKKGKEIPLTEKEKKAIELGKKFIK